MTEFQTHTQQFYAAEQSQNLLAVLSCKYPLWYGMRSQMFRQYLTQKTIFQQIQGGGALHPHRLSWKQLRWILAPWIKAQTYRRLFSNHKYLIVQNERKHQGIDIYTEHPRQQLGEDALLISFSDYHREPSAHGIDFDLFRLFAKGLALAGARWLPPPGRPRFRAFFDALEVDQSKGLRQMSKYAIEFVLMYYFFRVFLYVTRPQLIFLTVGYNNASLVAAAKSYNISTVEMQHGTIFPNHLGYHFPAGTTGDFFPDHLLLFSPFWGKSTKFPTHCRLISMGNDALCSPPPTASKSQSIVFFSQDTISRKIEQFLLNNLDILEEYKVYFKLHPKEYQAAPRIFSRLFQIDHPNLEIIASERPVATLQAECTYQVGVYSTALFEGLQSGCYTILLEAPGIEYMEPLIQEGYAWLVQMGDSLKEALPHAVFSQEFPRFFEPFNPLQWQRWLSGVESQIKSS